MIQSVRFDRKKWTQNKAKTWMVRHHLPYIQLDVTPGQYRFRVANPSRFRRMVTLVPKKKDGTPSKKGVSYVLGYA